MFGRHFFENYGDLEAAPYFYDAKYSFSEFKRRQEIQRLHHNKLIKLKHQLFQSNIHLDAQIYFALIEVSEFLSSLNPCKNHNWFEYGVFKTKPSLKEMNKMIDDLSNELNSLNAVDINISSIDREAIKQISMDVCKDVQKYFKLKYRVKSEAAMQMVGGTLLAIIFLGAAIATAATGFALLGFILTTLAFACIMLIGFGALDLIERINQLKEYKLKHGDTPLEERVKEAFGVSAI